MNAENIISNKKSLDEYSDDDYYKSTVKLNKKFYSYLWTSLKIIGNIFFISQI